MAQMKFERGESTSDVALIASTLAPLGVRLHGCPPSALDDQQRDREALLAQSGLGDAEKDRLLGLLDPIFDTVMLPRLPGQTFATRDLVVLHPDVDRLDEILGPFAGAHRHDDHETRWIVDGEGVFGFMLPSGEQVAVTVAAGDFIQVPSGVEHWFVLTPLRRIKAVRHFTDKAGWVPRYTGTRVRL